MKNKRLKKIKNKEMIDVNCDHVKSKFPETHDHLEKKIKNKKLKILSVV